MATTMAHQPLRPIAAVLVYIGFVGLTLFGYFIYELVLHDFSGPVLILSTFGHLLFFGLITDPKPSRHWRWPAEIGQHAIWYALFVFAYWYFFWTAITAEKDADLALGILALVIVCSAVCERVFVGRDTDEAPLQRIPNEFWITSIMLVVGVLMIKLNLEVKDFYTFIDSAWSKARKLNWYPAACLMLAVLAEAGYEVVLASFKKDMKAKQRQRVEAAARAGSQAPASAVLEAELSSSSKDLEASALLPCFVLAIMVFVGSRGGQFHSENFSFNLTQFGVYSLMLTVVVLVAFAHRKFLLVDPSQRTPRRLPLLRPTYKEFLVAVSVVLIFTAVVVLLKHNPSVRWYWFWLALMALVGTFYRNHVINPLRIHRGLPVEGLGPWQALRVVVFWGLSLLVYYVLEAYVVDGTRCEGHICSVFASSSAYSGMKINMNFSPAPGLGYMLGAILIGLAFILRFRETYLSLRHAWRER